MASLAKIRSKNGLWKGAGVWASAEHITADTWWQGVCASEAISPIASVILQIPPTSAASDNQDFVEDAKLPGFMNQYYSSIGIRV